MTTAMIIVLVVAAVIGILVYHKKLKNLLLVKDIVKKLKSNIYLPLS